MAYTPDNLAMIAQPVGGILPRVFTYDAGADALATITGAGYFADGVTKGMRVGDIVDVVGDGPAYTRFQVASVSGAAATVAAPTALA